MKDYENNKFIIYFSKSFDKANHNHMQQEIKSDLIHRMLPALHFVIRVISKIVKIETQFFFIFTCYLCGS
jgi:type III secretory pathway component EscR